ncbi:DUF2971 domain-containing protein [Flavobacterium flavipallidum]|uniref:DUF2971 domain-containing protein n=1 Tax=Flavobacterium flavipallidum TaxID=3139140 RepID=A0ABU9HMA5_9FLAO
MKIFKYLSPDRIDVLENKSIRFTQARYLNDPFESLPFISKLMNEIESSILYQESIFPIIDEIGDQKLSINDIPKEYIDQIPKEVIDLISTITIKDGLELIPEIHPENLAKKLFSSNTEQIKINYSEKLKECWNKYFGILSLTQTNDNITMWSHYAQNHEGFVIEFDSENEFFNKKRNKNDSLGYLREVKYTVERPNMELISFQGSENEFIEHIISNILYNKSQKWSSEQELRLIYNLKNSNKKLIVNEQEIFLFNFPTSAIKNIFIGVNATNILKNKLENIIKLKDYSHVKIKYGELDLKDYKLQFKNSRL